VIAFVQAAGSVNVAPGRQDRLSRVQGAET